MDMSPSWLGWVCSLGLPNAQGGGALSWLGWCSHFLDSLHPPSFPRTPRLTLRPSLLPLPALLCACNRKISGLDFRQKKTNSNKNHHSPFSTPDSSCLCLSPLPHFPPIHPVLSVLCPYFLSRASLLAQLVKSLPAMQDTRVRSLGPSSPAGRSPFWKVQVLFSCAWSVCAEEERVKRNLSLNSLRGQSRLCGSNNPCPASILPGILTATLPCFPHSWMVTRAPPYLLVSALDLTCPWKFFPPHLHSLSGPV